MALEGRQWGKVRWLERPLKRPGLIGAMAASESRKCRFGAYCGKYMESGQADLKTYHWPSCSYLNWVTLLNHSVPQIPYL